MCSFRALFWNLLGLLAILSLSLAIGLVMFAKYHDCDPLSTGRIQISEQVRRLHLLGVSFIQSGREFRA